jgi:ferredoxin-like protein FixX
LALALLESPDNSSADSSFDADDWEQVEDEDLSVEEATITNADRQGLSEVAPAASQDSYDLIMRQPRCMECGHRPCMFVRHKEELEGSYQELLENLEDDTNMTLERKHSIFRFNSYRSANVWLGGSSGKGNRTPLPKCTEVGICSIAPSEHGYTEFKAAK